MDKVGEDLTQINKDELEILTLNFSRCTNRDVRRKKYNITKRLSDTQDNTGYRRKPQRCRDFPYCPPLNRAEFPAWTGFLAGVQS